MAACFLASAFYICFATAFVHYFRTLCCIAQLGLPLRQEGQILPPACPPRTGGFCFKVSLLELVATIFFVYTVWCLPIHMERESLELKFEQAAELIKKHEIDAASLVKMLAPEFDQDRQLRFFNALPVMRTAGRYYKKIFLLLGWDPQDEHILAWLNEFRFSDLPKLVGYEPRIEPCPALLVFRVNTSFMWEEYKKYKRDRRIRDEYDEFFDYDDFADYIDLDSHPYIEVPYIMTMPIALTKNDVLRYYFGLSKSIEKDQFLFWEIYFLAFEIMLRHKVESGRRLDVMPEDFSYFAYITWVRKDEYLWLFFEAMCK